MQQRRTRSLKPKLFECKGYGDCNMVFTRSEHLARHARKHTGEKPYVCVVPDCNKAFSRFDNMMQHTQTHRNNHMYNYISNQYKRDIRSRRLIKTKELYIQTKKSSIHENQNTGLVSPISLSSLSPKKNDEYYYQRSDAEEDDLIYKNRRRLSIAELCNPIQNEPNQLYRLTKDEFEALEGLTKFNQ